MIASILAFSICKLASIWDSRWRSAAMSARSRRFWSAIVIAPTGRPSRFIDGRIDLGDTPIKVGDCSTLDPEASFDVSGSVGEGKIYGCHVVEVGAREEAEHTDGVQPHQHANHQDQDEAQEGWRRGPMLRQPSCRNQLSGLQHCAHDDDGPEGAGKDRG